jgi:DNA-binding CsgD family transcriptional regulator
MPTSLLSALRPDIRRRRDELVLRVQRADTAAEVFAAASTRLRRLVPFDAALWLATDPTTGLLTAPTRIENIPVRPGQCATWLRVEYVEDDNPYRDLARAEVPSTTLRAAVGDPQRSSRYRKLLRFIDVHDELRLVLRVGDSPWGTMTLHRHLGRPAFTRPEILLAASLSAPLGEALRVRARPTGTLEGLIGQHRPGLLLFTLDRALRSADAQARAWLAELTSDHVIGDPCPNDLGVTVPVWLMSTVFRASAVTRGQGDGTARVRVRTRRGRWLVCHASCLRGADGSLEQVAVVIEPATATDLSPIIAQAYDLSAREQQITRLIARGASTADMADALFLSPYTVRDHVKAVLRKVGVSSRGELVARLFAEYYESTHNADVTQVHDN